jgi:hypothetical protein
MLGGWTGASNQAYLIAARMAQPKNYTGPATLESTCQTTPARFSSRAIGRVGDPVAIWTRSRSKPGKQQGHGGIARLDRIPKSENPNHFDNPAETTEYLASLRRPRQ